MVSEVKIELLKRHFAGESQSKLAMEFGVNVDTIRQWGNRYREYGIKAFPNREMYKSYTAELKLQVVQDYLQGGGSEEYLALKYDIPSRSTINRWINQYNDNKDNLKSYKMERIAMTKGRKTTLDVTVVFSILP